MNRPQVVSPAEWEAARAALLVKEKHATRARDALAAERRRLPMVRVDDPCSGCSMVVDNIGHLAHLHARDTSLVLVSRAPVAEIEAFSKRMGWTVPWFSSSGSGFDGGDRQVSQLPHAVACWPK